jgi:hypothetical protein
VVYNPRQGRFYGRPINPPAVFQPASVPIPRVDSFPYDSPALTRAKAAPFVLNLPFKNTGVSGAGPIGWQRSPAQLVEIKTGPFAGQLLVSESDNGESGSGEMIRAFIEQASDGEMQGAVFHFTRNTAFGGASAPSGFSRNACMAFIAGPDGNFYCGANGATAAGWTRSTSVLGSDVSGNLVVQRWWDRMSDEYGCCRVGVDAPSSRSTKSVTTMTGFTATVQTDRSRVRVTFPDGQLAVNWQYYFRWTDAIKNAGGSTLYGTEAFYTLNAFGPASQPVSVAPSVPSPAAPFQLIMAPDGSVRLNISADRGAPYRVTALGLDGRTTSVRRGRGSAEVLLAPSDLPRGVGIVRVETGGRAYSRLISR